jgi:hypothetical protein
VKFFIDNCISRVQAQALGILGEVQKHDIHHLRDFFPEDTKDVEWIRALGEDGDWVIVSGDPRISRSKAERAAWHESGLTAFFFADDFGTRGFWKQAEALVHWWPVIVLEASSCAAGSGYLVPVKSKALKPIYSPK